MSASKRTPFGDITASSMASNQDICTPNPDDCMLLHRNSGATLYKDKFRVSVEGNIGSGKSTLLNYFKDCPTVEVYKEPVDKWTNLKGENALDRLYKDPKRWSFSFNNYVMLTRVDLHRREQKRPVKMVERTLYSTKYCFVEHNMQHGTMNDLEYSVLNEWFTFLTTQNDLSLDLIVYLRASPETCHARIQKRARKEESTVPLSFIEELHELHEDWLIHQRKYKTPAPVLVLDANHELEHMKTIYEAQRMEILCGHTG